VRGRIPPRNADSIVAVCADQARLESTPVDRFVNLFVV